VTPPAALLLRLPGRNAQTAILNRPLKRRPEALSQTGKPIRTRGLQNALLSR